jgi:hypothetical protein
MEEFNTTEEQARDWAKLEEECGCDISVGSDRALTEALASIQRGIQDAKNGRVQYLGSFAQYVEDGE